MEQMLEVKKSNKKARLLGDIIMILVAILTGMAISKFVIFRATVDGKSMEPTYYHGDVCMALTVGCVDLFGDGIQYGDVVIVKEKSSSTGYLIKRVIGTPGDEVYIKDCVVYINGIAISEGYILDSPYNAGLAEEPIKLGINEYFVMGDNRSVSRDSRTFGAISKSQIMGVVVGEK